MLLCVEPPPELRRLERMIAGVADAEVVGSVERLEGVPDRSAADVVIVSGFSLEETAGLIDRCAAEEIGVLVVANEPPAMIDEEAVVGLLEADATAEELSAAVYAVAAGLSVGPPHLFSVRPTPEREKVSAPLTPREAEVLRYVADGFSNREIARYLDISENTVKYHLARVMTRLGAANRTEAVLRAVQRGELEV